MLGHPILGDDKYGSEQRTAEDDSHPLCLAAVQVELPHPHTGVPLLVRACKPEEWVARFPPQVSSAARFIGLE